jgi:hypothetical protein
MDDFIENLYEEWIDEFNLTPLTTERFSDFDEAIRLNQRLVNNMTNVRRRIMEGDFTNVQNIYNTRIHPDQTFWRDFFNIVFDMNAGWNNLDDDSDNFEDVKITLTQDEFNTLNKKTVDKNNLIEYESKECNICMDTYKIDDIVIKLGCNHLFHVNCIKNWLCKEKITCPVCRKDVREYIKK